MQIRIIIWELHYCNSQIIKKIGSYIISFTLYEELKVHRILSLLLRSAFIPSVDPLSFLAVASGKMFMNISPDATARKEKGSTEGMKALLRSRLKARFH